LSKQAEYDPQSSAISSAYVSLFNDYVRRDLKYGEGQTYLPEGAVPRRALGFMRIAATRSA
jgi:hypothetical protein